MNIAVFEDDKRYARIIDRAVEACTGRRPALNTDNLSLLKCWADKQEQPSLYFLDVVFGEREPSTLGLEAARYIARRNRNDLIVFITAYPVRVMDETEAKVRAFNIIFKTGSFERQVRDTIALAANVLNKRCLVVQTCAKDIYIPFREICCIQTVKGTEKIRIQTLNGEYIVRARLNQIYKELDGPFAYAHRGCVVNQENVREVDAQEKRIRFVNGAQCDYAERYRRLGNV